MRDIAVFILFGIGLFYAMKNPYYGVLLWSLFNYMNPHRLTWGLAYDFPFVYIIAIVTIISFVISKEKRPIGMSGLLVVWILFLIWMSITTLFALEPDSAITQLTKVMKIQLPVLMTLFLFYSKERIDQLIAVIVFSLGFYGVKGGIFTLATGGGYIVWGPAGSFIQGNNELAIAVLTAIPLVFYLRNQTKRIWLRRVLLASAVLMLISVVGTQSRGAFLAMLALAVYFWWRSPKKMKWGMGLAIFAVILLASAPETWKSRMESIQNYEEDASAMGRIRAWRFATSLANARVTGGGFNPWTRENYLAYTPSFNPEFRAYVAHSIYFSVLGEHGWIGLVLYLLIFMLTWRQLGLVIRRTRGDPGDGWMADLADMLKISMIAYFVGGAFLSISYFDLPWHLVAISVLLGALSRERETEKQRQSDRGFDNVH
ncbi:MAG TPA: putative O-glycosylation ligase, exosortase A system-associated [Sedimenticola thiotaurini]|uniref:O-glycosylation ligase, exosortase A system-associated n=1 Tax=Sedimenticola thiotaurini TaxID=1543721 RepID=A0A831WAA7_9GAMM|nr:putative O-glycosylation ligase, exosortase A system-associated [Sedimenticola thiotaurini]